ncbi:hypothetical protein HDU96_004969 [Phlyctochytrium bullatum]|nr:hypothetical protein HDU96_004969 [Phlyctochytrium bullatum]
MFGSGNQMGSTPGGNAPAGSLHASIDRNPYGVNPLFSSTPNAPKEAFSVTPQLFATTKSEYQRPSLLPHFKVVPKSASKIKLRGFTAAPSPKTAGKSSVSASESGLPSDVLNLLQGDTDGSLSVSFPESFKPRVKKLVLSEDLAFEQVPESEHKDSHTLGGKPGLKNVRFTEVEGHPIVHNVLDLDANAHSEDGVVVQNEKERLDRTDALFGEQRPDVTSGYVMSPSLEELDKLSDIELTKVVDFKVTKSGIGEVKFLKPVNLLQASPTGNRDGISKIPGTVIVLQPKVIEVYPDDAEKDPVGMGVNVAAEITLEGCWAFDKKTGRIVTDNTDPQFDKHFRKLESVPGTKLLGFNPKTGQWRFKVEHFSRYGLEDESEDSDSVGDEIPENVASIGSGKIATKLSSTTVG